MDISLSEIDRPFALFDYLMGQMIVITFLFYSGYGIATNLRKDWNGYLHKLISKKFLGLLLRFDIIVLLYHLLSISITGELPDVTKVLLTFIGWESAGNSCWYIFYILISYILIYVSFRFSKNFKCCLSILFVLFFGYTVLISNYKEDYWYNTALVLPFGMLWAFGKEKIEGMLIRNYLRILISTILVILLFSLICFRHILLRDYFGVISYNVVAILLMSIIVLVCYKFSFRSDILNFIGRYVFPVYILQRLSFIFFKQYEMPIPLYFIVCVITTLLLVSVYEKINNFVTKRS